MVIYGDFTLKKFIKFISAHVWFNIALKFSLNDYLFEKCFLKVTNNNQIDSKDLMKIKSMINK